MNENMFCESCGKIVELKDFRDAKLGVCICGVVKIFHDEIVTSEKVHNKAEVGEGVTVEIPTQGFPNICKKCGYGECDVYDLGASYSDESDVYLYKCKKCGYVERQADGSGNK